MAIFAFFKKSQELDIVTVGSISDSFSVQAYIEPIEHAARFLGKKREVFVIRRISDLPVLAVQLYQAAEIYDSEGLQGFIGSAIFMEGTDISGMEVRRSLSEMVMQIQINCFQNDTSGAALSDVGSKLQLTEDTVAILGKVDLAVPKGITEQADGTVFFDVDAGVLNPHPTLIAAALDAAIELAVATGKRIIVCADGAASELAKNISGLQVESFDNYLRKKIRDGHLNEADLRRVILEMEAHQYSMNNMISSMRDKNEEFRERSNISGNEINQLKASLTANENIVLALNKHLESTKISKYVFTAQSEKMANDSKAIFEKLTSIEKLVGSNNSIPAKLGDSRNEQIKKLEGDLKIYSAMISSKDDEVAQLKNKNRLIVEQYNEKLNLMQKDIDQNLVKIEAEKTNNKLLQYKVNSFEASGVITVNGIQIRSGSITTTNSITNDSKPSWKFSKALRTFGTGLFVMFFGVGLGIVAERIEIPEKLTLSIAEKSNGIFGNTGYFNDALKFIYKSCDVLNANVKTVYFIEFAAETSMNEFLLQITTKNGWGNKCKNEIKLQIEEQMPFGIFNKGDVVVIKANTDFLLDEDGRWSSFKKLQVRDMDVEDHSKTMGYMEKTLDNLDVKIGDEFKNGSSVDKNLKLAEYWYTVAAKSYSAEGQYKLAKIKLDRNSPGGTEKEIIELLSEAAKKGHTLAQIELGEKYYSILGSKINKKELKIDLSNDETLILSADLFLAAASKGGADAQYLSGRAFEYGHGRSANRATAMDWYRKSAEQGNDNASKALRRLIGENVK